MKVLCFGVFVLVMGGVLLSFFPTLGIWVCFVGMVFIAGGICIQITNMEDDDVDEEKEETDMVSEEGLPVHV